jgi:hypothetical protein
VIATGTPEQVADNDQSFTGQFLRRMLGSPGRTRRVSAPRTAALRARPTAT